MKTLLLSSFLLQGAILFFDELYFHRKRGLPLWEKFSHPIDSFSVLICYLFLFVSEYNESKLKIFIGLSVLSCLLITKDEFVHKAQAPAAENWLHALLFIVHPVPFIAAGLLWAEATEKLSFGLMAVFVLLFMLYQIIYWSFFEKSRS